MATSRASFLSPVPFDAPDVMPWNWNPGATFMTAYYDAQQNQRKQQEFEISQFMQRELYPLEKQKAELNLEKALLEIEKTKGELERQKIETRQMRTAVTNTNSGILSAMTNPTPAPSPLRTSISRSAITGQTTNPPIPANSGARGYVVK